MLTRTIWYGFRYQGDFYKEKEIKKLNWKSKFFFCPLVFYTLQLRNKLTIPNCKVVEGNSNTIFLSKIINF